MNPKSQGEKGQRVAIGELAKWEIDVAIPMTDNLPWDFILIYKNKLLRVQVKSGQAKCRGIEGSVSFNLESNNWHRKTCKKYTSGDCDLMILCDYENIYLLGREDFEGRRSFNIRKQPSRNGQTKGINFHDDYVFSTDRLDKLLN
jgi:hypothetical protein